MKYEMNTPHKYANRKVFKFDLVFNRKNNDDCLLILIFNMQLILVYLL